MASPAQPKPVLRAIDLDTADVMSWREAYGTRPVWAEFLSGDFIVALRFRGHRGQALLTEVRVYPWDGDENRELGTWSLPEDQVPPELPPAFVKNLALGSVRDQAVAALSTSEHPVWPGSTPEDKADVWYDITSRGSIEKQRQREPTRRSGRRPVVTDLELAEISFHYHEAARLGERVYRYIGERRTNYTEADIRNRIFKAREKGFLVGGGGEKGRRGGVMSQKALEVLVAADRLIPLVEEAGE